MLSLAEEISGQVKTQEVKQLEANSAGEGIPNWLLLCGKEPEAEPKLLTLSAVYPVMPLTNIWVVTVHTTIPS